MELFTDLYVEFVRGRKKIKKDSINNAFKSKVLPLFEKKLDQITYSFERLIQEIAAFDAKIEAYRLFSTNYKLFEMIYESEDYSRFEIRDYNEVLEDTDIFNYYDKIAHPYRYQISTKDKKNKNKNLEKSTSNFEFETDEQALILNFCLVDKNSIPLTEKIRLLILIGKIDDESILKDASSDNDFYQKISNGIHRRGSIQNRIILMDNILLKIEGQKLERTIQTIRRYKIILQNEQRNKIDFKGIKQNSNKKS